VVNDHRVDTRYTFLAYDYTLAYNDSLHMSLEWTTLEGSPSLLAIGMCPCCRRYGPDRDHVANMVSYRKRRSRGLEA
jgi:hypothetical protein